MNAQQFDGPCGENHEEVEGYDTYKNYLEKDLNDETAGYLRTKLANRIEIRHTPKIRFVYDKSIAYGNKIESLINEIHKED